MNNDLISRETALSIVERNAFHEGREWVFRGRIMRELEEVPAVDAEPVRHGCEYCSGKRVEYQQTKSTKLYINTRGKTRALETECNRCPTYARCSLKGIPILAAFPINYCPNCGAKIDGDVNATD